MKTLDGWLADMPSSAEVDQRIAERERELQLLRVVRDMAKQRETGKSAAIPMPNGNGNGNGNGQVRLIDTPTHIDPSRISDERRMILRAMLGCQGATAGPAKVEARLRRTGFRGGVKPIQTNMGRMEKIGLLERLGKGRYRVPPHVAELVSGEDSGA